ncbi:MAG: hypothetical protein H6831_02450 [Planctomycetes bacterium]|nr:hypothetical protein [Planctomycetota bacterium]MCB9903243.1 hypothetical protein [Planctomycetota bacterium]
MRDVVIVSACRTSFAKFLGRLQGFRAPELGGLALAEASHRAGIDASLIDRVIRGNLLQADPRSESSGPSGARRRCQMTATESCHTCRSESQAQVPSSLAPLNPPEMLSTNGPRSESWNRGSTLLSCPTLAEPSRDQGESAQVRVSTTRIQYNRRPDCLEVERRASSLLL